MGPEYSLCYGAQYSLCAIRLECSSSFGTKVLTLREYLKAVVGGPAMAGPLFWLGMVLAGPHFWSNMFSAGPFSHVSSRPSLMIYFSMIKD